MQSEMQERLARLLCGRQGAIWEEAGSTLRDTWRADALAILNELREPTQVMVDAGIYYAINIKSDAFAWEVYRTQPTTDADIEGSALKNAWYAGLHRGRTVPAEKPVHASDCALHNGPATALKPCDCGADPGMTPERYGSEFPAQEPVAAGFVLVPEEPTPDMRIKGALAWVEALPGSGSYVDTADACYKAMLAAAPVSPPAESGEVGRLREALETIKAASVDGWFAKIAGDALATATAPADHRRVQDAEIPPSALDQPSAWWAETGTAGAGEGCNKPFWLRHEAVAYVRQHGGYVAPLFRRYEAPQPGGAVKVKALEWVEAPPELPTTRFIAQSEAGTYYVRGDAWRPDDCVWLASDGIEAAKAAAQADYERRILSALEPSPSGWNAGEEEKDWRERDLDMIAQHEKAEAFKAGARALKELAASYIEESFRTTTFGAAIANHIRNLRIPLPTPPAGEG